MENEKTRNDSSRRTELKVVFAGGGTGGHLFPGIAIADEIRRRVPGAVITFIGTKKKIEARVVPQRGYNFSTIWISGFRRRLSPENFLFPIKVAVALVQSYLLMKKLRPDVVVGTGGYVCGPPLFVASALRIPTLIQEQNSFPGVTTRRLASRVREVHISFEKTKQYLGRPDNVKFSGNPTNALIGKIGRTEGAGHFDLDPEARTILVFGGSLGATSINNEIGRILPELLGRDVQLIWQTGMVDFDQVETSVRASLNDQRRSRVRVLKFIEHMEFAYAAADVAICRAGASTLAELAIAGVPSILVPYPFAAADHQTENARTMVEQGAAMMIPDRELNTRLLQTLNELLADEPRRRAISRQALALGKPDAAATIAEAALALAGG